MMEQAQLYELIKELAAKKIRIWLEEETLRFKAPKDALDAELKNRMVQNKLALIEFLKAQAQEKQQQNQPISPRPDLNSLPVSHAQRRLWFIDQYSELQQKAAYNIPVAIKIRGALNIEALQQALHTLVKHHEVLQTVFENHKGLPRQIRVDNPHPHLHYSDLRNVDAEEKAFQCQQMIEANLATIFELHRWPLFKAELLQLEEQEFIFLATLHHIIADGWSMNIVVREIGEYYRQLCEGGVIQDAPLPLQYADFAYWQSQQQEQQQKQLDFWLAYLANSSVLELPLDNLRSKQSRQQGAHARAEINTQLAQKLNALAAEHGATVFMVLLAAFNILLSRFSQQKDINVGIPIANRNRKEWEGLIGFFVNSLVLRSQLTGNPPFVEFLKQVQNHTLAIYSNQDLPFDRLVDAMQIERESLHTPLFQVMFSLQSQSEQTSFSLANLELETLGDSLEQARYDMTWNLSEHEKHIAIDLEYRSDLFHERTVQAYLEYFNYLLQQIVENPHQTIDDYYLQDPQHTLAQQLAFNPPASTYPKESSLYALFEQTALGFPNQIAISSTGDDLHDSAYQLSYHELHQQSELLAAHLQAAGLRAQDKIILALPRSAAMIQAALASLKLGACYVPLDPAYPDERKQFIAQDAQPVLLLTSKHLREGCFIFQKLNIPCLFIEDLLAQREIEKVASFDCKNTQQQAACVFYTSGSTGTPKGVVMPHRAIVRLVKHNRFYLFNESDVTGHISNVCFDAASMEIWGALLNGGRMHIVKQADLLSVKRFAEILAEQNISTMFLSMGLFRVFAQENPRMFGAMKCLLIGGEAVDLLAARAVLHSGAPPLQLMNGYGPTENATFSACYVIKQLPESWPSVPLGQAISHSKVFIADSKGRLLPAGIAGELLCAGDGLALGYLNQEKLTQEKFVQGRLESLPDERIYLSGDLARYGFDGNLILSGRLDEQIKLRGFRIEPGEIENKLEKLDWIQAACVTVKNNPKGDKFLVAYLVLREPTLDNWRTQTKAALQEKLPAYMQPSFLEAIERIPVNANGKVDKRALPEPDWSSVQQNYVAPESAIEQKLERIWCDLLSLERVSIDANFFELGGHSLLATRLASQIQETFAVELKVREVFSYPSIEQQARYIQTQGAVLLEAQHIAVLGEEVRYAGVVLSRAQQRLWFIHQMNPHSSAYGMPMAIRLQGELDEAKLETSIQKLIERHESLRTVFKTDEHGVTRQYVQKHAVFKLEKQQLYSEAELKQALEQNERQSFDLETGALFKAGLLELARQNYVLLMNMHHIISDGWSMQILQQDLLALYRQEALPELEVHYVDFAAWQHAYLDEARMQALLAYWLKRLEGVPHVLHLPLDKARPAQQSFRGGLCHHMLDESLQKRALDFCKHNELSSFVLGISCYALLLSKYANQADFCIGIPVSGRGQKQIENLIGFFVNGIVIRSDLRERLTVSEMLAMFKQQSLSAFEHQELSADVLLEAMHVEVNSQYQPLAQVAFSHLSLNAINTQAVDGVQFEVIESTNHSAKYDLMLSLTDTGNALTLACEYAADLFDEASITNFLQHYEYLLDQILIAGDTPIQELELYSHKDITEHVQKYLPNQTIACVFALSFNQQAIYLDWQINPHGKQNAIAHFLNIDQKIDVELWRQCFVDIQQQHDVFRTRFHHLELSGLSKDYQVVYKEAPQAFNFVDYRDRHLDFESLIQVCEADAYCAYDLAHEIPYQYTLYQLSEHHFVGMLRAHHIIFDGVSGRIFLEEMAARYQAALEGKQIKTERERFSQFIQLEHFQIDRQSTLAFWKQKAHSTERLSFHKPAHAVLVSNEHFSELKLGFSADESRALKRYCREQGITPAIYFKCIYAVLIQQYCRAEADFVIREYAHGRPSGFDLAYGVYYQQTPFVVPLDYFSETSVSRSTFEALFFYAKQFQKEIRQQRNISLQSQVSLFPQGDIGFMYNYTRFEADIDFGGKKLSSRFLSPRVEAQVQLFIREHDEHFECLLIFGENYFSDLKLLQRIHHLSNALVNSEVPDVLLEQDRQAYAALNQGYLKKSEPEAKVLGRFFEQAKQHAQRTAIITQQHHYSFAEFEQYIDYIAANLQVSVKDNAKGRVAIFTEFNHSFVAAIYAVCKSGLSYLPLSLDTPKVRLSSILQQAGVSVLLSRKVHLDTLDTQLLASIPEVLDLDALPAIEAPPVTRPVESDAALYTIFTSGSTGTPKGAQVSYGGVHNLLNWYERTLEIHEYDVSLIISAPGFDLTQKNLFAFLRKGASIVLPELEVFDPQHIMHLIEQHKVTHINCAPSAFYALLQEGEQHWPKLSSLRWVILGGEAIKVNELKGWYHSQHCKARMMNSYGPTECSDVVCAHVLSDADFDSEFAQVPLGQAIDQAQLFIVNPNNEVLPTGLVGEIAIGGACVGLGYLENAKLNQSQFVLIDTPQGEQKVYLSGDLGYVNECHQLMYLGRKDFQLKVRGQRLEAGDIESALRAQENVRDALVDVRSEQLLAWVIPETGQEIDSVLLRAELAQRLPAYMLPNAFVMLAQWPLNANGKIDRAALPEPDFNTLNLRERILPRNELEQSIAQIWCEVLALNEVGVNESFFELGGHSLLATRIVNRMKQHFGLDIQLRALFDLHTIADLAEYIKNLQWALESQQQAANKDASKEESSKRDEGFL